MITRTMQQVIQNALSEDIGSGDVTSLATIPADTPLRGLFIAKADGIIAGIEVAGEVFRQVDPSICFTALKDEGRSIARGDLVAQVEGRGPSILTGERTALNFMQRMSGIATLTHTYVEAVKGTRCIILDTRKTAPGLRELDKLAVRLGGGANHRIGLYDMVLIKDNHIEAVGGITPAVRTVRAARFCAGLDIEVEVTNLQQLQEALELSVQRIMLDNMDIDTMRQAVQMTAGRVPLEASGGISLQTVSQIAATGVDYISVGALTHSVRALDISLEVALVRGQSL
ncbi:MAG: carboxylating nicotinate-nucleotide diphosphorylase [Chloroflexi bacterium]|nr:carboxylating nicotinate-nucleotide diphosphorylase [Chloroflexota bacterium]